MFVRIVKMSFQEDKIDDFLDNFEEVKATYTKFSG